MNEPSLALPQHIAIVMDGNGRWAKARRRPRTIGHRAGARAVQRCIDWCLTRGIPTLTLFAFSSENWQRPADEVGALMQLFMRALDREVDELARRGVRVSFIGERSSFAGEIRERMQRAESISQHNTALRLNIAASYGGRWDIARAARELAEHVKAGVLECEQIDEARFGATVCLGDCEPPDLFIRTGGDHRISNFLLWQLAYAELFFTDTLWPDVDAEVLDAAVTDFAGRERRFGKTSEQVMTGSRA